LSSLLLLKINRYVNCFINAHVSCAGGREFVSQKPAKSHAALQMVRHRFNIYPGSCAARRYDAEMGTANSLHASV